MDSEFKNVFDVFPCVEVAAQVMFKAWQRRGKYSVLPTKFSNSQSQKTRSTDVSRFSNMIRGSTLTGGGMEQAAYGFVSFV
jgi:hypothetical protein